MKKGTDNTSIDSTENLKETIRKYREEIKRLITLRAEINKTIKLYKEALRISEEMYMERTIPRKPNVRLIPGPAKDIKGKSEKK